MEESLSNEYWKKRCELAERALELIEHYVHCEANNYRTALKYWTEFKNSPTDTALYTGFIDLLKANDMWYEFDLKSPNDDCHELRFWYNGTNFKQVGCIVQNTTVFGCFEHGLKMLKEITENTKP